jgi:DNA-directed RNA polymerase specialized sigma subunit
VVNDRAEVSAMSLKENVAVHNSYDMNSCPAPEPVNMENFGRLQYIIDRLPENEQFVLRQYFIHGWTKTRIGRSPVCGSTKTVDRILRNLARIDLTGNEPMITFRGKTFPLRGLNGCSQTA